jgi:hypothetical protein
MSQIARSVRIGLAIGLSLLLPGISSAGDLKTPTIVASAAAAADWVTTYHALKFYKLREANPTLRPLDREPAAMVAVGAAMDVGLVSLWNATVGQRHQRVAVAGLWTMAAFRTYLAIHNLRNETRVPRR